MSHLRNSSLIVAMTICTGVMIAPTAFADEDDCGTLTGSSVCAECTFSFCDCLYNGHFCASVKRSCATVPNVASTPNAGPIAYRYVTPCYWEQECNSQFGGSCNMLTNRCVTFGEVVAVGERLEPYYTVGPCP